MMNSYYCHKMRSKVNFIGIIDQTVSGHCSHTVTQLMITQVRWWYCSGRLTFQAVTSMVYITELERAGGNQKDLVMVCMTVYRAFMDSIIMIGFWVPWRLLSVLSCELLTSWSSKGCIAQSICQHGDSCIPGATIATFIAHWNSTKMFFQVGHSLQRFNISQMHLYTDSVTANWVETNKSHHCHKMRSKGFLHVDPCWRWVVQRQSLLKLIFTKCDGGIVLDRNWAALFKLVREVMDNRTWIIQMHVD